MGRRLNGDPGTPPRTGGTREMCIEEDPQPGFAPIEEPEQVESDTMTENDGTEQVPEPFAGPLGVWSVPILNRAMGFETEPSAAGLGVASQLANAGHMGQASEAAHASQRRRIRDPYQHVY